MSVRKEPWEVYDIWKSKQAYFTWLRGQIRKIWNFYPAKLKWKQSKLVTPPKGYTGRAKKLGECHYCKEMFAASHLEVDHVEMAGKCNSWETSAEFLYKLLDCNDNWVLSCKPCHKIKSLSERNNISFEQAALDKRVIEFGKLPKEKQLAFLQEHNYTGDIVSNAAKRKVLINEIFLKEQYEK